MTSSPLLLSLLLLKHSQQQQQQKFLDHSVDIYYLYKFISVSFLFFFLMKSTPNKKKTSTTTIYNINLIHVSFRRSNLTGRHVDQTKQQQQSNNNNDDYDDDDNKQEKKQENKTKCHNFISFWCFSFIFEPKNFCFFL